MVKVVQTLHRRPIGTLEPHEPARLICLDVGLPRLLPLAVEILAESTDNHAAAGWNDSDLL